MAASRFDVDRTRASTSAAPGMARMHLAFVSTAPSRSATSRRLNRSTSDAVMSRPNAASQCCEAIPRSVWCSTCWSQREWLLGNRKISRAACQKQSASTALVSVNVPSTSNTTKCISRCCHSLTEERRQNREGRAARRNPTPLTCRRNELAVTHGRVESAFSPSPRKNRRPERRELGRVSRWSRARVERYSSRRPGVTNQTDLSVISENPGWSDFLTNRLAETA